MREVKGGSSQVVAPARRRREQIPVSGDASIWHSNKEGSALAVVTYEQVDGHNCNTTLVEAGNLREHFDAPT
jgi:hypothetical protein